MKKIGHKILLGFLLAGLIPMFTLSFIIEKISEESIEKLSYKKYEAIRDIKQSQIESYFQDRYRDIDLLTDMVVDFHRSPNGIEYAINHKVSHGKNFFEDYIEKYDYYDLFLISPNGHIYYTAAKEADYQTNLQTGAYKDSNLGQVFRTAIKQKETALIDFAPYAPSKGEPASFIAKRLMNGDQLLGVLALQMPITAINTIMQQRSGLGETGETYLIGSDGLMRSDSYLSPDTHSVLASFKNPEVGTVKTEGAEQALSGKTDVHEIIDYNGNPVISAYAPMTIKGLNWAILAEIDVAETFAPIYHIQKIALSIALLMAVLITIFALIYARTLSKPIVQITKVMNEVGATFDFSKECTIKSKDEIGQAASALNILFTSFSKAINEVNSTMENIAQGKFSGRITTNLKGDLGILKDNVNASADSVEFTMDELANVMTAISNGDFKARMDEKIPGEFRHTVDLAMQSMDTAVTELGSVITKISHGEFDGRIATELKGDMDTLKNNVNQSVEQLETGMREMIDSIEAQSHGDLTVQVKGHYEGELNRLKEAFNGGAAKLNGAMNKVMQSAQSVSQTSQEVASGSIDLNERTQSQAASLEETAAAMEELTSTIKNNTDNARTADQLSNNSRQQALHGQEVMQETIQAITEIGESSQKIQEIIGLIDSIAFQTNLLALNAAVEAARAGEHGRGFAVVAGEVRNLAGKSADAARDIKGLIDHSAQSIKLGSDKIGQTSDVLEEINSSIQQVSGIVSEISAASQEQQIGVEQVNLAISQIDQTTQQNSALVEETTAAAETMNNESAQLKSAISSFKTSGSNNLLAR